MNKRHIAFLISDMEAGGAQRVASIICSYWATQGHDVTLITFEKSDTESFYPLHPSIKYKRLDLLKETGKKSNAVTSNLGRVRALKSVYKDQKVDILISFMPESNVLAILSSLGISNMPVLVSERSDPRHMPSEKIWKILRRLTYPFASAIICQTPRAAQFFEYHRNCVVIPNPLLAPVSYESVENIDIPEPFIAGLGRLGHEKGFDILISAFAKVKDKFPSHHLVILGEGHERKILELMITSLGLSECVHLLGQKKDPFSILHKACLFVMPSRFEGFPNALCEAMSYGLPVIASSNAAQSISFIRNNDNALIIESGNIDLLASKMTLLLSNSDRALELGANAQKIQNDLSVEKVCAQWDAIIKSQALKN